MSIKSSIKSSENALFHVNVNSRSSVRCPYFLFRRELALLVLTLLSRLVVLLLPGHIAFGLCLESSSLEHTLYSLPYTFYIPFKPTALLILPFCIPVGQVPYRQVLLLSPDATLSHPPLSLRCHMSSSISGQLETAASSGAVNSDSAPNEVSVKGRRCVSRFQCFSFVVAFFSNHSK